MNVFVARSFNDQDNSLVGEVDRILFSHGLNSVTGHDLGGDQLDEGVKRRIRECDCLIALATQRDQLADGGWTTHSWVVNEFDYAKAQGMDAIAVVEEGVDWSGMYAGHERIDLDRATPSIALLRLSKTIGVWKEKAGETWPLQILPEELAERLSPVAAGVTIQYQTVDRGDYGKWRDVNAVSEAGGVFLYINRMKDTQKVIVRVNTNQGNWQSPATAKGMPVTLKELT